MAASNTKILHVFSSLELGGAQRRFIDYVKGSNASFEHVVYAMDGTYDALKLVPNIKPLFDGEKMVPKRDVLGAVKTCRKLLKQIKPNLMITYNWGATEWVMANSLMRICPMIHIQDGFSEEEQSEEVPKRRLLRSLAYRRCNTVVVPSRQLERLALSSWKIPKKKLLFIPNGINLSRFTEEADQNLLAQHNLKPTDKIVGTVSGLRPEKNIGRLIEAFSKVEDSDPDAKLVIVGDGIGMAALKMLADRVCTHGKVIFTGNLPEPEKVLPAFTIFALSSDTEQMPLCVIEAMACGLPIASTDVGDVATMVSEDNRLYIMGREAGPLADNIIGLLKTPDMARRIGVTNKEKAYSDYALDHMIEAYDTLISRVIK